MEGTKESRRGREECRQEEGKQWEKGDGKGEKDG